MDFRKKTYTDEEILEMKGQIEKLSRWDIAYLIRFEPSGHAYFRNDLRFLYDTLMKRFVSLGGWTPGLSKAIDRARGR